MRLIIAGLIAVIAIQAFSAGPAPAGEVPEALASIDRNKDRIARDLGGAIRRCVARTDTNHIAFRGCIDWHSAVHGTWSLIAIMRATGTKDYDPLVKKLLTPENIRAETRYLQNRPNFEMPYGRAWFLRLAIDYEKLYGSDALRETADYVLGTMIDYLSNRDTTLQVGSYKSSSWAIINMIDYARFTQNRSAEQITTSLVIDKFEFMNARCRYDRERGNFMAVCTNLLSVAARILKPAEFKSWYPRFIGKAGTPRAVREPVNWHHYGLNFSRAWGLWDAYKVTGDQALLDAYVAHFTAAYTDRDNWDGDYRGVGHWVGQFGVYALQPLFGANGR